MAPTLTPARDLECVDRSAPDALWKSTGDDPGFLVRLGLLRRPYLVFKLVGTSDQLDPRLYVDYGLGFTERNALSPDPGRSHVILAGVGLLSSIRALRLDPASFPTKFSIRMQGFMRKADAEAAAERWCLEEPGIRLHRFIHMHRAWLRRLAQRNPLPSRSAREHAKAMYELAARQALPILQSGAAPLLPSGTAPWLSVVVPVYNTPPRYLDDLLRSYQSQKVSGTELVLSDDGSTSQETLTWLRRHSGLPGIKLVFNEHNRGIAAATNAGIAVAAGQWVTLLDHDDLVAPHAFSIIASALEQNPSAQFLYTDELVVNDRLKPSGYMAKPAYDPVLLSGVNYINHFSLYRRHRLTAIGGLRENFEGSQDYDLLLRYLDGLEDSEILHLPYPAYWWRRTGQTFSGRFLETATLSARKGLGEAMKAEVEPALTPSLHRISFKVKDSDLPRVSVVIPNRDSYPLISRVLADLFERTDYPDVEVIVVDNGTTDPAVLDLYERTSRERATFRFDLREEPFNFSRAVNRGIALASGRHYLLLNNDVEVIHPDWLREMVSCLSFERAGIVGAKLLYPDDTIQHAGVITGFGGYAGHWYRGKSRNFGGPMNRLHVRASMSCVTGAVMLISHECHRAVGDFDETNFAVAYNDVDYCLRAYGMGFRTIWTPFACLYHHESVSRGSDRTRENAPRFEIEKANLQRIHDTRAFMDPASSPSYSRNLATPVLQPPGSLPPPRTWFARGS